MDLPPDVVAKAWADIGRPSDVAKQRLAVRALSAAARYVLTCLAAFGEETESPCDMTQYSALYDMTRGEVAQGTQNDCISKSLFSSSLAL